jgi:glycosyltransferase involved in cell wall biosynthesis
VLNQTYKDFEIIVVDDGSTDNTRDLVYAYGDSIRYIYQENQGLAAARNTGIRASQGEFIGFLDADDYFLEDNFEKKITFLESNPQIDWVYSDWQYINDKGHTLERGSVKWRYANKELNNNLFGELLYNRNFISPCTVIVRKSALKEVGYFDPNVICQEDWDLWLRLSLKHPSYYIDEILVFAVDRPHSLSKDFSKWVYGNTLIVDKLKDLIPKNFPERERILNKLQADKYTFLGRDFMCKGKTREAFNVFFKSIKHLPYQKRIYWLMLLTLVKSLRKRKGP